MGQELASQLSESLRKVVENYPKTDYVDNKAYERFVELMNHGEYQEAYKVFSERPRLVFCDSEIYFIKHYNDLKDNLGPEYASKFKSKLIMMLEVKLESQEGIVEDSKNHIDKLKKLGEES